MDRGKQSKLHNVMFPIWMLLLFPITWIVVLPLNFLIDLLVLWLALKAFKVPERKPIIKKAVFFTWICGFLADGVGAALMMTPTLINPPMITGGFDRWWIDHMANAVAFNPFDNIFSFLWVFVSTAISALLIYLLNYFLCLRKSGLDKRIKRKTALCLALFTAPYLFFLPSFWLYGR